ncbi:hypothetical protein [Flaviaesturariibacter terrae]
MRYLLFLLLVSSNLFGQQVPDNEPESQQGSRDWYLKRGKTQKTVAWIMAGAGVLTSVIGAASSVSEFDLSGRDKDRLSGGELAFFAGAGLAVGSIPFFIAAGRNRRKGLSMSVKNETSGVPGPRRSYAALSLRLSL